MGWLLKRLGLTGSATIDELLDAVAKRLTEAAPDDAKGKQPRSGPPVAAASGVVDPGADVAEIKAGMDQIRDSLRKYGIAIAATTTTVVGALGWTQLHDVFPLPRDAWVPATLLMGAIGVAALATVGGAAWLASRFFRAQRRILMTTAERPKGLEQDELGMDDSTEKKLKDWVFEDHAREENAESLRAVELRQQRLARISRRRPADPAGKADEKADPIAEEAERLLGVIRLALARTALTILEHRAQRAFRSWKTAGALALLLVGLVAMFGIADWAKGERSLITLRANCQEAEAKGAIGACAPFRSEAQQIALKRATAAAAEVDEATAKAQLDKAKADLGAADDFLDRVFACAKQVKAKGGLKPPDLEESAILQCAQL